MHTVNNYESQRSVVEFVQTLLYTEELKKIETEGKGLDSPSLDDNLKQNNYIPVLKALWSEKDITRRITWLQLHQKEMHAPLMYEQAIAEFLLIPTVETILSLSLPFLKAATLRVEQDCQCWISFGNANGHANMDKIYRKFLNRLVVTQLGTNIMKIAQTNPPLLVEKIKKILMSTALDTRVTVLPSPKWVKEPRNGIFRLEKDFNDIRDRYAESTVTKLNFRSSDRNIQVYEQ